MVSSSGPDNISYIMLQHLRHHSLATLLILSSVLGFRNFTIPKKGLDAFFLCKRGKLVKRNKNSKTEMQPIASLAISGNIINRLNSSRKSFSLIWVPGHSSIRENELANKPSCGASVGISSHVSQLVNHQQISCGKVTGTTSTLSERLPPVAP